jgi:hypothetical protein
MGGASGLPVVVGCLATSLCTPLQGETTKGFSDIATWPLSGGIGMGTELLQLSIKGEQKI